MTDREAFLVKIVESPGDDAAMLVFADWLDEHGETDLAYAYRWCARRGKRPRFGSKDHWYWGMRWGKFIDADPQAKRAKPYQIPPMLGYHPWMTRDGYGGRLCGYGFKTFDDAMEALARRLALYYALASLEPLPMRMP